VTRLHLRFVVVLISLFSVTAHAGQEKIAQSNEWHRLLHYRKTFLGSYKSDVDGPEFFFSPRGKTDPLDELKASAEAFGKSIEVGKLKQHPQCAFPERYRFLKRELGLNFSDIPCAKLDEFLSRFHNPRSVSFVFSNAHPDNPASMFGHTFLRINASSPQPGEKLDLLDQGVSYAANVGLNENPLFFYWQGLTGGYPGAFTVVPYYVKVNEYSHAEARDLWEYDLSLNSEQTLKLLRHLWELETNSWFDYWFFDENCAFELLALLEVARPDWNLTDHAGAWVIPGETVKILTRTPGVVESVKFRPSYRRTLFKRFDELSPQAKEIFFKVKEGKVSVPEIQSQKIASAEIPNVLDALSADLTYRKQKNEGKASDLEKKLLTDVLIERSRRAQASISQESVPSHFNESAGSWNTRPDEGHDATRLSITSGLARMGSHPTTQEGSGLYFQEVHVRTAYHDLLNNDQGFLRFSQIEFPNLTLRYYPKLSDLRVERIGILSVLSLFPMTALEKKPSWGLDLEYQSPKDYGCLLCHTVRGRGYVGASGLALSPNVMVYGLALANAEFGESLRKGWRLGPGAQLAALANFWSPYKAMIRYDWVSDLFQTDRSAFFYEFTTEHSWSFSTAWELRAAYSLTRGYDEAKLGIYYYF
jgi:hypothetical protein